MSDNDKYQPIYTGPTGRLIPPVIQDLIKKTPPKQTSTVIPQPTNWEPKHYG